MTAGVQSLEPTAYLPPPSSASTSDAKATDADAQDLDNQGEPQDFQSEFQLQDTGAKESKSTARPETSSGKPAKKRDTRADDPNAIVLLPVPAAEPPKQILPLVLTLAKPEENAEPGKNIKPEENIEPEGHAEPVKQELRQQGTQVVDLMQAAPTLPPAAKAAPLATPDPFQTHISTIAAEASVVKEAVSKEAVSQKVAAPAKARMASESQPVSQAELNLSEATPPEPVAAAVEEMAESAPSRSFKPPALAFAARLAAAPQKAVQSTPENLSQQAAVASSQTPAHIPVRYAATAQILQIAEAENKQGLKKDSSGEFDRPVRAETHAGAHSGAHFGTRTDMVLPRFEAASQAPASGPVAPQQAAPTAHMERIIEPPAPPTSTHDIRVRVPDNNGGSTQVRFVESGGEVRVSVRTADTDLAQNLRTHLNDLTQRLADGGIPAEIFKPGSAAASQNDPHQPDRDGRGQGGQESGGRGGQQDRQENRPAWLEEMEASLHEN